jgi:hypothetical protein
MAALSNAGFAKINLITETGGPSSGAAPRDAQPEGRATCGRRNRSPHERMSRREQTISPGLLGSVALHGAWRR